MIVVILLVKAVADFVGERSEVGIPLLQMQQTLRWSLSATFTVSPRTPEAALTESFAIQMVAR